MPGSVLYEKQSGFLQAYPMCPLWEELRTRKCGEQYSTTLGCFSFFLANGYTLWGRVEGKCVRTYGTFQSGFTWLLSQYYERDLVTVKALFQKPFCFLLPFKKSPFNLPKWWEKERVLREKLTGLACSLVPVWPPPPPLSQGQNRERSALASKRKTSQGWVGGQGSFGVKVAIFQLLKQPPVLEENMKNWKEGKCDFYQICKSARGWVRVA